MSSNTSGAMFSAGRYEGKKLFWNADIVTMEEGPTPEALLCLNGKIAAMGKKEALLQVFPDTEGIDLKGAALLPAFVDAHSHLAAVASGFLQADLAEARKDEEITERIRDFIAQTSPRTGAWVQGRNCSPEAPLTLDALDAIAPQYPLLLQHPSGHCGWCNSTALRLLGIEEDTPDPEGGKYGREEGKLNGFLEENAYIRNVQRIPMPDFEAMLGAFAKAQRKYAANGIATVQEGLLLSSMLPMYQGLQERGNFLLDVIGYPNLEGYEAAIHAFPRDLPKDELAPSFRIGGLKMILDGSPQARTAWMRSPYQGEKEYAGYPAMTEPQVLDTLRFASEKRLQVLAHCNGDASVQQFLRQLQIAERLYGYDPGLRPILIHAQLMGRDQLEEAAALGAAPSFFVAHVYHWGDAHLRAFGTERASGISPAASALRHGLRFTFHQDSPVIDPNMLETLWCASCRITRSGQTLGSGERIPVYEALRAVTSNAAWQYHEENRKGTLRPGKQADLVVLSENPLRVPPEQLRSLRVLATYRAGEAIYTEQ